MYCWQTSLRYLINIFIGSHIFWLHFGAGKECSFTPPAVLKSTPHCYQLWSLWFDIESLEGISSIKLKSGCLSRASPRPLGTTLLPPASVGSAFPDSTHKWGHTAWLFCMLVCLAGLVHVPECPPDPLVMWFDRVLFFLWMISISSRTHANCKQSPALTASKATRRRPPAQFSCTVSYIQTWTFSAEWPEQLDSTGKKHAP